MNSEISRRAFVATAVSAASASRVLGANDRIRLGIIGNGGRGQHLIRMAKAAGGDKIEWVAVCDAWDQRRDEAAALIGSAGHQDRRLPRAARPQGHRRRHRRHPRSPCTRT